MRGEAMRRLREETRVEHERLESRIDIVARLSSREEYAELVRRFYGAYATLEPFLLARVPREFPIDFQDRRKLPALLRDLDALGISRPDRAVPDPPRVPSGAAVLGALYVVEGSSLGGQIISRLLQERLGITAETGGEFFAGYRGENGPMWRAFGSAVEEWIGAHGGVDEAVAGARETFGWMERALVGSAV